MSSGMVPAAATVGLASHPKATAEVTIMPWMLQLEEFQACTARGGGSYRRWSTLPTTFTPAWRARTRLRPQRRSARARLPLRPLQQPLGALLRPPGKKCGMWDVWERQDVQHRGVEHLQRWRLQGPCMDSPTRLGQTEATSRPTQAFSTQSRAHVEHHAAGPRPYSSTPVAHASEPHPPPAARPRPRSRAHRPAVAATLNRAPTAACRPRPPVPPARHTTCRTELCGGVDATRHADVKALRGMLIVGPPHLDALHATVPTQPEPDRARAPSILRDHATLDLPRHASHTTVPTQPQPHRARAPSILRDHAASAASARAAPSRSASATAALHALQEAVRVCVGRRAQGKGQSGGIGMCGREKNGQKAGVREGRRQG
eukprot:357916-Chlamydomonas_euryale.AAC.12